MYLFRQLSVIGDYRSAFKRIDKFSRVKTKHFRVAEATYDNYMLNSKVGQPADKPAAKKS